MIDEKTAFLVNVGLGMGLSAAVLASPSYVALPAALYVSRLDNAGLQVGWGLTFRRYQSAATTVSLALLPMGIAGVRRLIDDPEYEARSIARGVASGVAGGTAIAAGMMPGIKGRFSRTFGA